MMITADERKYRLEEKAHVRAVERRRTGIGRLAVHAGQSDRIPAIRLDKESAEDDFISPGDTQHGHRTGVIRTALIDGNELHARAHPRP